MPSPSAATFDDTATDLLLKPSRPVSWVRALARPFTRLVLALHGLTAFALITLGVMVSLGRTARRVIYPLVLTHVARAGLRLLPMTLFLASALGLIVIGQTVSLLSRVGANDFLGTVMVTAVVRELGPLLTALLVLSRAGTANVVELGTTRALGEVEALEVLGIDPIHYLVVPRVIGMALGAFALAVYVILAAVVSGYVWAFVQDVPLLPGDYFRQLAASLRWLDFVLLGAKTMAFGVTIAVVTCYHGLAQPLQLAEVSHATVRAVGQSVVLCAVLDAVFIIIYLVA